MPVQVMSLRKRDKKKNKNRRDAERLTEQRQQQQLCARRQTLRPLEDSNELLELHVGARMAGGCGSGARWTPSAGSAVEVEHAAERTIIGVDAAVTHAMLTWLAPKLAHRFGQSLAARSSSSSVAPRGASVILASAPSSSGPHRDGEDTLLLNLSGTRRVWFAPPSHVSPRVPRHQARPGAPVFLPDDFDPTVHVPKKGVRWHGPLKLFAGDAIWIRRGWWHCISSEAESVAVPIEVVHGCVRGCAPRVFRRVASRKTQSGRSDRLVSRRANLGSASSARRLWASAL